MRLLQAEAEKNPDLEWFWIDFPCMPQDAYWTGFDRFDIEPPTVSASNSFVDVASQGRFGSVPLQASWLAAWLACWWAGAGPLAG